MLCSEDGEELGLQRSANSFAAICLFEPKLPDFGQVMDISVKADVEETALYAKKFTEIKT